MLPALAALPRFSGGDAWTFALLFAGTFVGSIAIVTFLVVRMPADYLSPRRRPPGGPAWLRATTAVLKNLIGIALVAVGVVLSLPGIPGQGVLTILVGLMLTDLPGVRRLERALARRPAVQRALNSLRARFGREPLRLE